MELYHIRHFSAVAETGSFTKAATRASASIAKLEEELGVKLFLSGGRHGLAQMMPVRGRLDLRCSYGTPWRSDQGPGEANEIPYHAVLAGSATLEDPARGRPLQLKTGDILLLPGNPRHVMHDGSGAAPYRPPTARPSTS